MSRRWCCAGLLLFLLLATEADAASGVHLTVNPTAGGRTATFMVTYVAPSRTGVIGSMRLRDEVRVETTATSTDCQSSKARLVPDVRRGEHVRVAMRAGPGWCAGTYKGKLVELQSLVCPPGYMCAQYIRIRTLGSFSFVVAS